MSVTVVWMDRPLVYCPLRAVSLLTAESWTGRPDTINKFPLILFDEQQVVCVLLPDCRNGIRLGMKRISDNRES